MNLRPISDVAQDLNLDATACIPYGQNAKVQLSEVGDASGKLVLVTGVTPTPAGEGKTTVGIALTMGLRALGRNAVVCLREPSLGPIFGIKGGGTGGGQATVEPAESINLHFTGDIHAVGAAHNLLSTLIDNSLHFGHAEPKLDARSIDWPRVVDMNDRALRHIVVGLRGDGVTRESRFDVTAASEIMAVLGLASDLKDLRHRLGRIVVGHDLEGSWVTAQDMEAADAMTALLKNALLPNLAQTSEGGPAIIHGGPFANIAHGCSSALGTRLALSKSEITVTEAGFGFDLGGEKFLQIKCREAKIWPDLVVVVTTLRALRMHGGAKVREAGKTNPERLRAGLENLDAHLDAIDSFGVPAVVAVNRFEGDAPQEIELLKTHCLNRNIPAETIDGFRNGGLGSTELAAIVAKRVDANTHREPQFLYSLHAAFDEKVNAVATRVYGAREATFSRKARRKFEAFERAGFGHLPVCMAKTHRSLSDDPRLLGRPRDFSVHVADARLSAGAGFVVALLGDIRTMPGLPRRPAAASVRIDAHGNVSGLMPTR